MSIAALKGNGYREAAKARQSLSGYHNLNVPGVCQGRVGDNNFLLPGHSFSTVETNSQGEESGNEDRQLAAHYNLTFLDGQSHLKVVCCVGENGGMTTILSIS